MLQSILCSDIKTNPLIHEASYFRSIVDAYATGKMKFDEHGKYYFHSVEHMRVFTANWARSFLELTRERYPESEHLVLKHPPLTPKFPAIFELLSAMEEDVRFFIIVRDPRDVVASLVRVGERLRIKGDPEGRTLPRDMRVLGNYYIQTYLPAFAYPDPAYRERISLVKYEDLVTNTGKVVDEIRKSSGLSLDGFDFTRGWSDDKINYDELESSDNAWLSELWGKEISATRIGNYKSILDQDEINIIETLCAGPIKVFGY